jgi:GTP-dependent dephospho-CoA kinase
MNWYLPGRHRDRFKEPFGRLFPDIRAALDYAGDAPVFAVGDVVTYNLVRNGVVPEIAVIDGITMREPCNRTPHLRSARFEVENPPGMITGELINTLLIALKSRPSLVHVKGEEDLAVIPLVRMLPDGSAVFYGQPGEGVVVKIVDEKARVHADELFSLFEMDESEE